jgi:phosphoribosylformylglycinamidine synthase
LAESCIHGGHGCELAFPGGVALPNDDFTILFSESPARALVTASPEHGDELVALADQMGVPVASIGTVTGGALDVTGLFEIPLDELSRVWRGTLPAIFG